MKEWKKIAQDIERSTGGEFNPLEPKMVGGGCINTGMRFTDGERSYFVKLNRSGLLDMFDAESEGLKALADTRTIRVPSPVCCGVCGDQAYLVMEFIEMGHGGRQSAEVAGRMLAAMHQVSQPYFGWHRDNTIGSTPQLNQRKDGWIDFWRERRLGFQLQLAADNGYRGNLQRRGERLLDQFHHLLDHQPKASILHGDLWGGNLAYDRLGQPVIYDPAVYYGDREADLAMTELFGGFGRRFYDAYQESWPLSPGYATRKVLYNLYHILNHLNLFGGGYLSQAEGMIDRLLAEI
ncbi:MAG: fructosamine kinase family protein [Candidatus Thiodiazotropha sp.]